MPWLKNCLSPHGILKTFANQACCLLVNGWVFLHNDWSDMYLVMDDDFILVWVILDHLVQLSQILNFVCILFLRWRIKLLALKAAVSMHLLVNIESGLTVHRAFNLWIDQVAWLLFYRIKVVYFNNLFRTYYFLFFAAGVTVCPLTAADAVIKAWVLIWDLQVTFAWSRGVEICLICQWTVDLDDLDFTDLFRIQKLILLPFHRKIGWLWGRCI